MENEAILVLYDMVPESVDFFLIPSNVVDAELKDLLENSHGKYINFDEDGFEVSLPLYERLYEGVSFDENGIEHVHRGDLAKYKISDRHPLVNVYITSVYKTGMMC